MSSEIYPFPPISFFCLVFLTILVTFQDRIPPRLSTTYSKLESGRLKNTAFSKCSWSPELAHLPDRDALSWFSRCGGRECTAETLWGCLVAKNGVGWGKLATSIYLIEVRDIAKYPVMHKTAPHSRTKIYAAQNINGVKVENSCPKSCICSCWSTAGYRVTGITETHPRKLVCN